MIWLCNHETSARVKLSPFSGRPAYAARAPDSSVELANAVAGDERLVDQHAQYRPREIGRALAPVDVDAAAARLEPYPRDGVLPFAGGVGAAQLIDLRLDVLGNGLRRGRRCRTRAALSSVAAPTTCCSPFCMVLDSAWARPVDSASKTLISSGESSGEIPTLRAAVFRRWVPRKRCERILRHHNGPIVALATVARRAVMRC